MKYVAFFLGCFWNMCAHAQHLDAGIAAFQKGHYAEAEHILQQYPHDSDAHFFLSLIHLFDIPAHPHYGLHRLQDLAHEGHNMAMDTLAGLYLHGNHPALSADAFKALRYYEMAAQRGYGPAQFNCGILYKKGEKTPRDLEKAYLYLSLAALNNEDLDTLCQDAAHYRDDVAQHLTPEEQHRTGQALIRLKTHIQRQYKTPARSPATPRASSRPKTPPAIP